MESEEHTGNRAEKRKREPNFTTRELTIISENVEANIGILQSIEVYQHFQITIRSWNARSLSNEVFELLGAPWVNKFTIYNYNYNVTNKLKHGKSHHREG